MRDRNTDGRYVSAGMIEDDYSHDSWPDTIGVGQSPFIHRERGKDGPCVVYKAGEEER